MDFGFLTTLFKLESAVGELVHSEKEVSPLVEPVTVLGIVKPSVSESVIPMADAGVSLLQKTPKSNPSPAFPTV